MLRRFIDDIRGVAAVEFSLISGFLFAVTLGAVELGFGYMQYNSVQQAARTGARLAAVSDPVAGDLTSMTGLGGGVSAGDPLPDYTRVCSGATQSCSGGSYSAAAMNALLFGPDSDGVCANTQKTRRGLCDVQSDIKRENVTVTYAASGLGVAGNPAAPAPLITVKVTDIKFDFLVIGALIPAQFDTMPAVEVTVMAEDLRTQS